MLLLLFFFLSASAFSAGVFTPLRPGSNFLSVASQGACSLYFANTSNYRCNPALHAYLKKQEINFTLLAKTEGDSVENGYSFVFEKVEKEDLEELFENKNYNSISGNLGISFRSNAIALDYIPAYAYAAFYVYNPAFPKISLYFANYQSLEATKAFKMSFGKIPYDLSMGATGRTFTLKKNTGNFSLADLAGNSSQELAPESSDNGLSVDLGFTAEAKSLWLPDFAALIKNAGSPIELDKKKLDSATEIEPFLLFETYSSLSAGKTFNLPYGWLTVQYEAFYSDFFEEFYKEYSPVSAQYGIGPLRFLVSYSKYLSQEGVYVESDSARVGLLYSSQKARGALSDEKDNSLYLSLEYSL